MFSICSAFWRGPLGCSIEVENWILFGFTGIKTYREHSLASNLCVCVCLVVAAAPRNGNTRFAESFTNFLYARGHLSSLARTKVVLSCFVMVFNVLSWHSWRKAPEFDPFKMNLHPVRHFSPDELNRISICRL